MPSTRLNLLVLALGIAAAYARNLDDRDGAFIGYREEARSSGLFAAALLRITALLLKDFQHAL